MMEYWVIRSNTPLLQYSIHPIFFLHPHNIVSRVDMQHFAGNRTTPIAAQVERGLANFRRIYISLEWRALGDVMQHGFKVGDSCGG